jgi:hypothetical protein
MSSNCDDDAYVCHDCLAVFLFDSDFALHSAETGHKNMARVGIDAAVKLGEKNYLLFELR